METYSQSKNQSWLSWFLRGILILGFLVLFARLADLQIIRGSYFRSLSEGNRIRRVLITAPRGKIIARGGEVLVTNKEIKAKIVFDPKVGYEKIFDIKNVGEEELITEPVRNYLLGASFAHASGYLGEVNKDEVGKIDPECLEKGPRRLGSLIGRTGLEEMYECKLRGIDGEELIEVDSLGNKIRILGRKNPIAGESIKTTIHYGLQQKISELMRDKMGAIVVADTKGQVLALYSSPSYDPNIFVNPGNNEEIKSVFENKELPLFNRAIGGVFHPGSIFKPIIAIAALEEGVINKDYMYEDTGVITIDSIYGRFTYSNWYFTQYGGVEGKIDLTRAIARSTDTFFYKTGELLGIEKIDSWANKFGLDNRTGIDIPGEVSGLVPSPDWKKKVKGERWFLGNTYHVSIGQGDIALTPLGINTAIGTIASNGKYCQPHLLGGRESKNYQLPITNYQCKDLGIKKENIDLVKKGMVDACSAGGTGFPFFDTPAPVACKTGTAETDNGDDTHAWFTFFAPVDDPEIVVTVLVEKGGEGSRVAGPIAREIYDFWFGKSEILSTKLKTNSNY